MPPPLHQPRRLAVFNIWAFCSQAGLPALQPDTCSPMDPNCFSGVSIKPPRFQTVVSPSTSTSASSASKFLGALLPLSDVTLSLIAACLPAAYARRPFVCLSVLSVCRASQFDDFIVSNMIYLAFPPTSHHLLPQWPSSRRCSASLHPSSFSCSFSSLEPEGDPRCARRQASTAWNRVRSLPLCLGFSSAFDMQSTVSYSPLVRSIPG